MRRKRIKLIRIFQLITITALVSLAMVIMLLHLSTHSEDIVQQVIGAMLEEMGHRVNYAIHGEDAVRMYRAALEDGQGYDIVICDLTIPGGMGGQDTAREILKFDPQAKIVVSSGYATDPVMASYTEYGFKGRVAKPYSLKGGSADSGTLTVQLFMGEKA